MNSTSLKLYLCLIAIPIALAQSNDLAQKSRQAYELMAAGKFEEAIPFYL